MAAQETPSFGAHDTRDGDALRSGAPSKFCLAVAAALNLPLVGLINGGPNFQAKLVQERGFSWEEAAGVFDMGLAVSVYGGLLVSVLAPPLRLTAVSSLFVELIGFAVLGYCSSVGQITLGLGLVAWGGTSLYLTSLRLSSSTDSTFFGFLFPATFSMSAYTSFVLLLPGMSLDLFCLLFAVLTLLAAVVAWFVYEAPEKEGSTTRGPSWGKASGLREPRYWAFCFFFCLCCGGLTWGTGCYDGTVASTLPAADPWTPWLTDLFPLVYNLSILWIPLFGVWVKCHGFVVPGLAMVVVAQLLLACLAWPSKATLVLAMLCGSFTNSVLFSMQVVYLHTFPREEFPVLLSGTLATQALCFVPIAALPKEGAMAAKVWLGMATLMYIWPCVHLWTGRRSRHRGSRLAGVHGLLAETLATAPGESAATSSARTGLDAGVA